MTQSFTPWQPKDYPAGDAPFNVASMGGPQPYFRDELDWKRAGWRATPEAQYPDGYLGTINTRRQDRLLQGLKQRTTNKPYTRGIHKGERRDPSDYQWPLEFNLMSGLENQLTGMRYVSPGVGMENGSVLTNDGKPTPGFTPTIRGVPGRSGQVEWSQDDPDRQGHLRRMAPPWSAGGPGMAVAYPGR